MVLKNRAWINVGSVVPPPPPGGGCTYTIGYWKNHPDDWPLEQVAIGGVMYSKADAIKKILKARPRGDATIILARQLLAALLNEAAGADTREVLVAMAQADAWLVAHPLGSDPGGDSRCLALELAKLLDDFNNGRIGPGHCED